MRQLVIIGASGHGKVAADIAKKCGYEEILFLDDNESVKDCNGYPVVGKTQDVYEYDCDVAIAIGNAAIRKRILEQLESSGKSIPVLIHPSAIIGENVSIGKGTVIAAGAIVNPAVRIGKGCIINTSSSVDHDCMIEDYVHISVGAHVAGTVCIGTGTWVGAGAIISNNIDICSECIIGAGAVVVKKIDKSGTYIGVPAKRKE